MGKEGHIALPVAHETGVVQARPARWGGKALAAIGMSSLLLLSFTDIGSAVTEWTERDDGAFVSMSCHQAEPLLPMSFDPATVVQGQEGRIRDWLSGAVQIPTEMFDVMGPIGEDHRWDIFYNFSDCQLLANPESL